MSPQQPDGISNIRSWNVRNAGQSDLTKRGRKEGERGRRAEGRTDRSEKEKEEITGTSGTVEESLKESEGLHSGRLC